MKGKLSKFGLNRRRFVQGVALSAVALGSFSSVRGDSQVKSGQLKCACYRFPRTESLFDGNIAIDGFAAAFEQHGGIGTANTHTLEGSQPWDITEIGLGPFMTAYANDDFRDYTLLPIYLLKQFRHKSIYIRTDRGIKTPQDLRGRAIATPGYSSSSLVWIRGMLEDEYGVSPQDIDWVLSSKDSSADVSGEVSKQESLLPSGIKARKGPAGLDESELLVNGDVDALFHAVTPRAFLDRNPIITRLFENSREVELDYYRKTGIFPIMHTVAVRKKLLAENPGTAKAIFEAFSKAKSRSYAYMAKLGWGSDMLPWYSQELEQTVTEMGSNFYSYGFESNRKALETLCRYSYEQGLTKSHLKPEELYHPESQKFEEA